MKTTMMMMMMMNLSCFSLIKTEIESFWVFLSDLGSSLCQQTEAAADCVIWFNSSFRSYQMGRAVLLHPPPASSSLLRPPLSSSVLLHLYMIHSCRKITALPPHCFTVKLPAHLSEFILPHVLITNSHFNYPHWHCRPPLRERRGGRETAGWRKSCRESSALNWIGILLLSLWILMLNLPPLLLLYIPLYISFILETCCVQWSWTDATAKETISEKMRSVKYLNIWWTFWCEETTNTENKLIWSFIFKNNKSLWEKRHRHTDWPEICSQL